MDLAWAPDGTMYGAVNDALYRVDPATGQATLVTKLQGASRVMGLAIDHFGNFYVSEIVANAPLFRVNPATGATTKLFDTGVDYIHGLATRRPLPLGRAGTSLCRSRERHRLGSVNPCGRPKPATNRRVKNTGRRGASQFRAGRIACRGSGRLPASRGARLRAGERGEKAQTQKLKRGVGSVVGFDIW